MNVTQYTFQSPSSSQVQVGKPVQNSQKEDTTQKGSSEILTDTSTTVTQAKSFEAAQTTEVTPTVESSNALDLYA